MNFYQCFIKGYTKLACLLYDQISADNAAHKKKKIQWTEEAFDMLKVMCTLTQVLAFTDFTKPFNLHTDASTIGLGAILYQEQGRKDQVIGYASSTCMAIPLHHMPITTQEHMY